MKFQNPSIHHSKVNTQTDRQTDTLTDKPKAICPSNFFKVGGIKNEGKLKGPWKGIKEVICYSKVYLRLLRILGNGW